MSPVLTGLKSKCTISIEVNLNPPTTKIKSRGGPNPALKKSASNKNLAHLKFNFEMDTN